MHSYHDRPFNLTDAVVAAGIGIICIFLISLIREPHRQKISALSIAGAGAIYWSGGLGYAEYIFGSIMLFIAFKGLTNYTYIGIGWLLHTCWDILHHLYGDPIIVFSPSSSAGCAVCDPVLAIWYLFKAPSVYVLLKTSLTNQAITDGPPLS